MLVHPSLSKTRLATSAFAPEPMLYRFVKRVAAPMLLLTIHFFTIKQLTWLKNAAGFGSTKLYNSVAKCSRNRSWDLDTKIVKICAAIGIVIVSL